MSGYVGRFAPSPTGPLHAGSLVAALGSWLDARAQGGRWLVRIEDTDTPRCVSGAAAEILRQLAACGLVPDAPPWFQSMRGAAYAEALQQLRAAGWAFDCACSRADVLAALRAAGREPPRHGELVYLGTCRGGLQGRPARAVRMLAAAAPHPPWPPLVIDWHDRRLGAQRQDLGAEVGDFVVKRADGLWAYQLAVVVDDAAQGITDVVRGEDLADSTPRQLHLQHALGLPQPRHLHLPLVRGDDGEKLSKGNGAAPVATAEPVAALAAAARVLGLPPLPARTLPEFLAAAVAAWAAGPGGLRTGS